MGYERFYFLNFVLDPHDRQLLRDGQPVVLSSRYLDALILMVKSEGQLVSKDRFMAEVWGGVPVTDEALTQCIRTLRRQLGDKAINPALIETVVKHGYRFVAPVEIVAYDDIRPDTVKTDASKCNLWLFFRAGTVGAVLAGLCGGLVYGLSAAARAADAGMGAVSVLLVTVCLTLVMALIGGAAVSFGIGFMRVRHPARPALMVVGGAAGGLVIGAVVKLIGLDAFMLLLGRAPVDITGAPEGAVLGGAVGAGVWLAGQMRRQTPWVRSAAAAMVGALAGLVITVSGGRLMAGSLVALSDTLASSRLTLEALSQGLGEASFGLLSRSVTGAFEGALFAGGIAMAILWAEAQTR